LNADLLPDALNRRLLDLNALYSEMGQRAATILTIATAMTTALPISLRRPAGRSSTSIRRTGITVRKSAAELR